MGHDAIVGGRVRLTRAMSLRAPVAVPAILFRA